ncbi:MAG: DUF3073 domain-containing protein [Candidatus Nanopelagicales bacterium]
MGRGRAKAKQTKVARQLKYGGPSTDLERLQAELAHSTPAQVDDDDQDDADYEDLYAKYVQEPEADEDEPGEPAGEARPQD